MALKRMGKTLDRLQQNKKRITLLTKGRQISLPIFFYGKKEAIIVLPGKIRRRKAQLVFLVIE